MDLTTDEISLMQLPQFMKIICNKKPQPLLYSNWGGPKWPSGLVGLASN